MNKQEKVIVAILSAIVILALLWIGARSFTNARENRRLEAERKILYSLRQLDLEVNQTRLAYEDSLWVAMLTVSSMNAFQDLPGIDFEHGEFQLILIGVDSFPYMSLSYEVGYYESMAHSLDELLHFEKLIDDAIAQNPDLNDYGSFPESVAEMKESIGEAYQAYRDWDAAVAAYFHYRLREDVIPIAEEFNYGDIRSPHGLTWDPARQ